MTKATEAQLIARIEALERSSKARDKANAMFQAAAIRHDEANLIEQEGTRILREALGSQIADASLEVAIKYSARHTATTTGNSGTTGNLALGNVVANGA